MADYKEKMFFGTAQTVINLSTDIADGNFAGGTTEYNNTNDAVVPYARYGLAVASFPDWATGTGNPVAGSIMSLWMIMKNTDGLSDDTGTPSGTNSKGARCVGTFQLYDTDEAQRRSTVLDLLGVTYADFYLKNESGVISNNDGGTNLTVKIIPFATGYTV